MRRPSATTRAVPEPICDDARIDAHRLQMNFPDLENREKRIRSQNGEDGVIEALFECIGETNRYFVEFGVGDASECNTAALLERGWKGLMMDMQDICRNPLAVIRSEYVFPENINALFRKYRVPDSFDLLSIDIDGNDFWVWREIAARARVVVIEYNAAVPADECRTIVYEPGFGWNGSDYYGASLLALKRLGELKRYTLVYCDRHGVNAFFVANEALPVGFEPRPIEQIYRPPNFYGRGLRWPPDPTRHMIDPFFGWNVGYFRIMTGMLVW
jgi:hypothetical protein